MSFQKSCIAAFSEDDSFRAPNKLASSSPNFAPPPKQKFSSVHGTSKVESVKIGGITY